MYGLLIDTSTPIALLAITKNGAPHCTLAIPHANQLSQSLLPSVQSLLKDSGLSIKELHYIAVGAGPGSYTGTRVGIAAAKTLSYALSLPLIRFISPIAFLPQVFGEFAHILPSKTQTFYLLKGRNINGLISHEQEGSVLALPDLLKALEGTECIITPDPAKLKEQIFMPSCTWLQPAPNFEYLSSILYDKYGKKEFESEGKLDVIYFHSLNF